MGFSNLKQKAVTFLLGYEFFSLLAQPLKFPANCYLKAKVLVSILNNINEDQ